MLRPLKNIAVRILEFHPIGYALGVEAVTRFDFLLPHEEDYWGFERLATGRSEGLFLDLGANLGHSARGFHKVLPNWKVFSVEANPAHQSRLKKIKDGAAWFDFRIAAIDSESGQSLTFFVPYYRGWLSLHSSAATTLSEAKKGVIHSFPHQEKRVRYVETQVETITIDDLDLVPGIIKMDIQGKEVSALQGARRVIENHSPDFLVEVGSDPAPIVNYFKTLGYFPYTYERATDVFIPFEGTRLNVGMRNLFFSRRALNEIRS